MADVIDIRDAYRHRARHRKAAEAVDAILYAHADRDTPHPDVIDALDDEGWADVSALVSAARGAGTVAFDSPETRAAVRAAYRVRWEYRRVLADMPTGELFNV